MAAIVPYAFGDARSDEGSSVVLQSRPRLLRRTILSNDVLFYRVGAAI